MACSLSLLLWGAELDTPFPVQGSCFTQGSDSDPGFLAFGDPCGDFGGAAAATLSVLSFAELALPAEPDWSDAPCGGGGALPGGLRFFISSDTASNSAANWL